MDEGILWYSVCLCKCGQQARTEKMWARANPVVQCVSVQVWSTDHVTQDEEDVRTREVNGTVCVCAGLVNRPCDTGRRRREDEGSEWHSVCLCRCGQQTVWHRAQKT